jgi:hypothetical protein
MMEMEGNKEKFPGATAAASTTTAVNRRYGGDRGQKSMRQTGILNDKFIKLKQFGNKTMNFVSRQSFHQ